MIDCVLSYHVNPQTCGTAKFNLRLARELGVPCYQVETPAARIAKWPLLSLRHHECSLWRVKATWEAFDVFLHEWTDDTAEWLRSHHPMRLFAGNAEIAAHARALRPDTLSAWCPSTIEGNPHRGTINVLTFGMAHKIQTTHYEKLKSFLDATGEDYTVSVSTAIHEGSPWDETAHASDRLRSTFGHRLRVLGYLSDDALSRELRDCSAVALFYEPALRANNTTAWAALDAGRPLITNRDQYSPHWHVYDISTLTRWPNLTLERDHCPRISPEAGWPRLSRMLQEQLCES